jgi:putative peptidoglycan lipid II flippase
MHPRSVRAAHAERAPEPARRGTLSASFIPVYSKLLEKGDEEAAGRLAGAIFALLLACGRSVVAVRRAVGALFSSASSCRASRARSATHDQRHTHHLPDDRRARLSAWALGILNSHRKFFVSYTAPVLWNAAMITVLLVFGTRLDQRDLVVALCRGEHSSAVRSSSSSRYRGSPPPEAACARGWM